MEGVAVTRIGDQNFEVKNCQHINFTEGFDDVSKKEFMDSLIDPLIHEGYDKSFIQNFESKVSHFLSNILTKPCEISNVDLKSDDDKEYKLLFHKLSQVLFVFFVCSLSDSEMREIERNTESKTYFTGDMDDMFKTKKDFH